MSFWDTKKTKGSIWDKGPQQTAVASKPTAKPVELFRSGGSAKPTLTTPNYSSATFGGFGGTQSSTPQQSNINPAGFFPATVAKILFQAPGRATASITATAQEAFTGSAPIKTPQGAARIFLGSEPIGSLSKPALEASDWLEKKGVPRLLASPFASGAVAAIAVSDLTPLGGQKNAFKAIVGVKTAPDAAALARAMGVAEDLVPTATEAFLRAANIDQAKAAFQSIETLQRTTKPVSSAIAKELATETTAGSSAKEAVAKGLTEEQFMKGQGTPLYHGYHGQAKSPSELKYPLYTIDNAVTAKKYATGELGSTSGRLNAGGRGKPTVFEFSHNPDSRVLDLRNPEHMALFKNNSRLKALAKLDFNGNPFVSDKGMVDFFISEEIAGIVKDKKLPFDSIAFDERGGRGVGFMALNKNALKTSSQIRAEYRTAKGLSKPSSAQQAVKDGLTEEQFVKGQGTPLYHGGGSDIEIFKDKGRGGVFLTSEKRMAQNHADFAEYRGGKSIVTEAIANPKKVYKIQKGTDSFSGLENDRIIEQPEYYSTEIARIKAKGFDALQSSDGKQLFVFDVKNVKTTSQLRAEYRAALREGGTPNTNKSLNPSSEVGSTFNTAEADLARKALQQGGPSGQKVPPSPPSPPTAPPQTSTVPLSSPLKISWVFSYYSPILWRRSIPR